ncbi:MAG TPA: hypothetical protein VGH28_28515 [Polyangiaceae bacterium]|jgi:hypothetical protein
MANSFRGRESLIAVLGVVGSALVAACSSGSIGSSDQALGLGQLCGNQPCDAVAHGAHDFFDRTPNGLNGNGRACSDCHMATDSFQLSPADVEARYEALQAKQKHDKNADDPLFRPIDADDFRTNGNNASDYSNLRENGLIRITFPLPSTMQLVDPDTMQVLPDTEVDVWRSVPTVLNVKLTGPDQGGQSWFRGPNLTGGYQLDARKATLQDQALGAFQDHAQVENTPSQGMLDDIAAFENSLFSSDAVRDMSLAIDNGLPAPDPDPELTPLEQAGKAVFARSCAQCHGGPSQSNAVAPVTRYSDIDTQCPRPVDTQNPARWSFKPCPPRLARNARLYRVTRPNGQQVLVYSSDPGRSLLTGFASISPGAPPLVPAAKDDWQALDVPQLRDLKNTAPYFHNNSADTLDDVLDHYDAFFKFVAANFPKNGPIPPVLTTTGASIDRPFTPAERPALMAYLLKL